MLPKPLPDSHPFIAWTCGNDYNAPSAMFRTTCEKHIRKTMLDLTPVLGRPAVEGIIIYDHLERGAAVATILGRDGRSLPENSDGDLCASLFDEEDLCRQTNEKSLFARLHAGSRGMLVTLNEDSNRRLMLLDQREASFLHPMGQEKDFERGLAATGLLAHEMAHARDYADGRPGLPSRQEISARCASEHADAILAISDMALAEYIATRAECRAQVHLHGACSADLTNRTEVMTRQDLAMPPLDIAEVSADHGIDQWKADLSHTGYVLGTMAAYAEARAPPVVTNSGTPPLRQDTSRQVADNTSRTPVLATSLARVAPALERAATAPGAAARGHLAGAIESTLTTAHNAKREPTRPKARDTSLDDWLNEI